MGQFGFGSSPAFGASTPTNHSPGFAADYFGRKAVYGKELLLIIIATILCLGTPTGTLSPDNALIYLGLDLPPPPFSHNS